MLDTPIYNLKQQKMIQKYRNNNELRAFMNEVNPIYNLISHNEAGVARLPNVEQMNQILAIARKYAKSEDEVHMFIDYAKQLWEA